MPHPNCTSEHEQRRLEKCRRRLKCEEKIFGKGLENLGSLMGTWYQHFLTMEIAKYVSDAIQRDFEKVEANLCLESINEVCGGNLNRLNG